MKVEAGRTLRNYSQLYKIYVVAFLATFQGYLHILKVLLKLCCDISDTKQTKKVMSPKK